MIGSLRYLKERLDYEACIEGDNSAMPAKIAAICGQLCEALRALVAEETLEIAEGTQMAMAVQVLAGDVMKAIAAADLSKEGKIPALLEQLGKVDAKTSAHDQALMDMAHLAVTKAMSSPGLPDHAKKELPNIAAELQLAGAV